jgi:hypothetical protein
MNAFASWALLIWALLPHDMKATKALLDNANRKAGS